MNYQALSHAYTKEYNKQNKERN